MEEKRGGGEERGEVKKGKRRGGQEKGREGGVEWRWRETRGRDGGGGLQPAELHLGMAFGLSATCRTRAQ